MTFSFYWHDYETFGSDPRRDGPAQFAGIRTDEELNEIGKPLVIYCRPHKDRLPSPEACLITGITPQIAEEKGIIEAEFISRIHEQLSVPQTCGAGYNSLRFDDEVTRHTLYRNFFDPYAREWQNQNSRWDIIDLARMCYALRPEGIEWPVGEEGKPSFRLQKLSEANNLEHESAHDALSDVRATIGLAKLIRQKQPRLYKWLFELRDKRRAGEQLDLVSHKAVLHTSRMYPAEQGCTTLVMPICEEKHNRNSILVYDLRHDPQQFLDLDTSELNKRLFTSNEDLPQGSSRLPVKSVKINKCPALAPATTLNAAAAERIVLSTEQCAANRKVLMNNREFFTRISNAYSNRKFAATNDVDAALYDGFIHDSDRRLCDMVRQTAPDKLGLTEFDFQDERLPDLLFRYRARNWPESLGKHERRTWQEFCVRRINETTDSNTLTLADLNKELQDLMSEHSGKPDAMRILNDLQTWCDNLPGPE